jgi:drug/metabolite transporter (DMT)-like permease
MNERNTGFIFLVVVVVVWGSGPMAIGYAVSEPGGFGPLWLNGTRLVVAAVGLLAIAAARGVRLVPVSGAWRALVAGLVGWSAGNGLQFVAQTEVASGLTAVITGLSPAMALLLESAIDRKWPALVHTAGALLGAISLWFLVGGEGGGASVRGVLLLLASAAGWATGAVLEGRFPARAPPIVSAAWQMGAGGIGLCAAAWAVMEPLPAPSPWGWVAWAWLAVGCAAIGFLAWVEVLRRLPIVLAMTQPTLSTLISVALGAWVLGEGVGPWVAVGVALAVFGAALCIVPRPSQKPI